MTDEKPDNSSVRNLAYGYDVKATYYYMDDYSKKIPFEDIPNIPNLYTPTNYSVNNNDDNKLAMKYYMFIFLQNVRIFSYPLYIFILKSIHYIRNTRIYEFIRSFRYYYIISHTSPLYL